METDFQSEILYPVKLSSAKGEIRIRHDLMYRSPKCYFSTLFFPREATNGYTLPKQWNK